MYSGTLATSIQDLESKYLAAIARAERAEAALAEMQKPCAFKQEDEDSCVWYTDCGGAYWLEDGTPNQHYKFCPECGHPFIVRIGAPPSDNDLLSPGGDDERHS